MSVFYGEKNAFMPSFYLGLDKDLDSAQESLPANSKNIIP